MAKKKVRNASPHAQPMPAELQREHAHMLQNGLGEAIMGPGWGGQFDSIGTQINQAKTLYLNNRWYLVSNMRQLLNEVYVEHGIIETVVDVPVDDGLRGGLIIESQELDEEELRQLQVRLEQDHDIQIGGQAVKWTRLFGGGAILILTGQEWDQPLDEKAIANNPLGFRAIDMWELYWDNQNVEGDGNPIDNPEFEHYNYYGKKVHKSRVLRMKGKEAPSFVRPRLRGWGLSIMEVLVNSVNQYLKANNLTFEVLDEFKIDIFQFKGLAQMLAAQNGNAKVRERAALTNLMKNFQQSIVMDADDKYEQKQLSFTGIKETMEGIRMQIASDLKMPLTKVFGISATGFSSGEDDIENYNAMVESQVRNKIKNHFIRMVQLRCMQMFGYIPGDLTLKFHPLRVLSTEQEENVKTQVQARLDSAYTKGLISPKEYKEACNKASLLPVKLNPTDEVLELPGMGTHQPEGEGDLEAPPKGGKESATKPKESKEAKS